MPTAPCAVFNTKNHPSSVAESLLMSAISDNDLAEILSPLDPTIIHYAGEASLIERGREIWRPVVIALLSLGMIESLFAVWVGRER